MTRQQAYDRRRAAGRGELGMPGGVMGFVEVGVEPPGDDPATEVEAALVAAPGVTVEIVLVGDRVLRAPADLPAAVLRRLIGAVEGT